MDVAAELSTMSFDDACRAVVAELKRSVPLACWSVTQRRGDRQVLLTVLDDVYGAVEGSWRPWSESLCEHFLTGSAPVVVPDVGEITAGLPTVAGTPVRSYAGVAIVGPDGRVFGTLCGYDPEVRPAGLADQAPLLGLLATLLGQVMAADLLREQAVLFDLDGVGTVDDTPEPAAGDDLPHVRLREPLRRAIAAGDVVLHFQPIVDLASEEIAGFESLARWSHDGQAVPPDVFIPLAAQSGLLPALTELVLEQACAQIARWSVEHPGREVRVGVNVPPGALTDLGFPDLVAGALARHGLDAWQLVLEITEDALVTDIATSKIVTGRLQAMGTALSLDDFGTGYSSLLHLREIPFVTFKIDRRFAHDVDTDPEARRFAGALLALGRDIGVEVVVEGVERAAQAEVLRALGCRFVQGWHYGRPAPAAAVSWEVPRLPAGPVGPLPGRIG